MENKIVIHEPKKSLSLDLEEINKESFKSLHESFLHPTPLNKESFENRFIPFSPAVLNLSPKSAFSIRK